MKWILILWLTVPQGEVSTRGGIAMQEFDARKACVFALETTKTRSARLGQRRMVSGVCVPKGDPK